jgi:multisubunit Na+/H+ antiporter MnhB subunit
MMAALALDAILGLLICAVALGAILARDLWASIVFYIVYGALLAVAWVRLGSVDVALAEAAIGAGLTGILLIGAAARLRAAEASAHAGRRAIKLLPARAMQFAVCAAIVAMLLVALDGLHVETAGLAPLVEQNLALSGVTNPVTAVLLNFRGYDTLLEAVVLVVALVAVWSLTPERFWGGAPGLRQHARPDGVLAHFGRLLPAAGIIVGIHLLWAGSHAPGGAFQAGTVLAAVWLLVAMAGLTDAPQVSDRRLRLAIVGGPLVFLLVGTAGAIAGTFLGLPPGAAYYLIVAIEVALTVSIAATLAMLVLGVPRRAP